LNIEVKEFEMLFKDVSRSQTDPVARTPGPDGASPSSAGDLPVWDLADLYASTQDPQLSADLERAERDAKSLQERFRGRLGDLDGAALGAAIAELETLDEIMTRIMSYAGLLHAANMADPEVGRFYQSMQEKITNISSDLIFFTLEINLIDDDDLEKKLADEALARFRPWLRETRAFRPHQMDEALEKMAQDLSVSGSSAWVRLFDETMTALRFDVHGKELALEETLNFLTDPVEENRKAGAEAVGKVLGENARLFAHITNTLAKDKETRDRWRKFSRPVSSRNLSNAVEDEVVDALAITGSRRAGSAATFSITGTATHRYPTRIRGFSNGTMPSKPCSTHMDNSLPILRRWVKNSSTPIGSMPVCAPARRRALLPIRRYQALTPISCSISRVRPAT
jgi:hypothetical protein